MRAVPFVDVVSAMLTRRTLIALAVFTLVSFTASGLLGNNHHGVRQFLADISWLSFILGLLFLIVASGFVLARSSRRRRTA